MKRRSAFPPGWDEERVRRVLDHYELQSEDGAVTEDEAPFADEPHTVIEVPAELLPTIRALISKHRKQHQSRADR